MLGTPRVGLVQSAVAVAPPEDPSAGAARTVRDWCADVAAIVVSVAGGVGIFFAAAKGPDGYPATGLLVLDAVCGVVACVALWGRRRWPVGVGLLTAALTAVSASAVVASIVALFGAAVHRRPTAVAWVLAATLAVTVVFPLLRPQDESFPATLIVTVLLSAATVGWGMVVRSRRQLVWTLRERAERAEADQLVRAERARQAERTRIAREMHDVLAHRLSLLALHAGGLQLRPDLPPDEVAQTAGLLRSTAHQALEELRGVIGVLRDDSRAGDTPAPPQPTLRDIPRLVADSRDTGLRIDFRLSVPDDADAPVALGRDAYRIVQEALTNVAKHASGTAASVEVAGAPGDGLRVCVRNPLPVGRTDPVLPGAGAGLLGLGERVHLAGGTLRHGPDPDGSFVVDAHLAWAPA